MVEFRNSVVKNSRSLTEVKQNVGILPGCFAAGVTHQGTLGHPSVVAAQQRDGGRYRDVTKPSRADSSQSSSSIVWNEASRSVTRGVAPFSQCLPSRDQGRPETISTREI